MSNLDGLAVPQISVMDQPRKEGREATMFCWKCGKALADHANFCDQCGMPIQQRTQPTVTAQPPHQIPDIDTSQPNDSIPEKPIRSFAGIDTWAWVYATVPLLIQMVLSVLGYGGMGIIAVLIANTIFFLADRRNLELNGIMPASWMWLGIIIVPIYLFVRAHKINQKYGYAVLWCILFFISLSI